MSDEKWTPERRAAQRKSIEAARAFVRCADEFVPREGEHFYPEALQEYANVLADAFVEELDLWDGGVWADDPMARPHVDVSAPAFGGSIRLTSASGGLESLWIAVRDAHGNEVIYDRATGQHVSAPVRLTPAHARTLAELLTRYADSHRESR